jgi:hypothetical protein
MKTILNNNKTYNFFKRYHFHKKNDFYTKILTGSKYMLLNIQYAHNVHVGQMLFAEQKSILLKRITVLCGRKPWLGEIF